MVSMVVVSMDEMDFMDSMDKMDCIHCVPNSSIASILSFKSILSIKPALLPTAAFLLAFLLGCGGARTADEVLGELADTAQEMAAALSAAETLPDLEARSERLRHLARRMGQLQAEARAAGEASPEALARHGPRVAEALESIGATLADWSREGKWDMIDFVENM